MSFLLTHAVERWADETPDHPAFRFNNEDLSYAELWQSAGRLAQTLVDNGVSHGDRVGIYMKKCLHMPVAVYGIMRAGAVFVPLDASAPLDRLQHMIEHCGIHVLVTQPTKANDICALLKKSNTDKSNTEKSTTKKSNFIDCVIGVSDTEPSNVRMISWQEVDSVSGNFSDAPIKAQDMAYIMYTSGSTGYPKGIIHTHHSGLSYAQLAVETYAINNDDRLGNHSPLHFDMSTLDYFAGPLAGATTVLIPEAYTMLPASLSQLVEDEKLTIWYSVPYALIQMLLRGVLEQRDTQSIRWVLFGGEPFPPKHLYALMALWPQARFSNVYGPAEVNQCTYYHVPRLSEHDSVADDNQPIPIGHIWQGAKAIIVDDAYLPVAEGEVGELLICSATMMSGYWQQPELNADAYYEQQITAGRSERYYRTGDLVAVNSDGLINFIGRKDRQIKIRGYRVELDEVENVLSSHPQVVESGVFQLPADDESLQIEAAVIVSQEGAVSADELREFAGRHLPVYALPASVCIHSSFPRTASGKVDRRALRKQAMQQTMKQAMKRTTRL
jgi:amino acid adenylation domain-containing protein